MARASNAESGHGDGVSALLSDLKSSGLLASTLVVMLSEFGRTVGKLTIQGGRDHFAQQRRHHRWRAGDLQPRPR